MKPTKRPAKLTLSTTTLRVLSPDELRGAAGGGILTWTFTCTEVKSLNGSCLTNCD